MDEDYAKPNNLFAKNLVAVSKSRYIKNSRNTYTGPETRSTAGTIEVTENQLLSLVGLTDENLSAIVERNYSRSNKNLRREALDRERLWRNHSLMATLISVGGHIVNETKDQCRIPKTKYENPGEFIRKFIDYYQRNYYKEGGILFGR